MSADIDLGGFGSSLSHEPLNRIQRLDEPPLPAAKVDGDDVSTVFGRQLWVELAQRVA